MGRVAQALQPKSPPSGIDGWCCLVGGTGAKEAPITVIRVRDCEHEGCGCLAPSETPADALIIHVGCRYTGNAARASNGATGLNASVPSMMLGRVFLTISTNDCWNGSTMTRSDYRAAGRDLREIVLPRHHNRRRSVDHCRKRQVDRVLVLRWSC